MENQHRKIMGYRELDPEEIKLINEAKRLSEACGKLVRKLELIEETDKRCVEIGKTELQQGFTWLIRSIAKPTTF